MKILNLEPANPTEKSVLFTLKNRVLHLRGLQHDMDVAVRNIESGTEPARSRALNTIDSINLSIDVCKSEIQLLRDIIAIGRGGVANSPLGPECDNLDEAIEKAMQGTL